MKTENKHVIDSIQALRAIAFIGIFLWHAETGIIKGTGNWGVCIFFILSGFLLGIKNQNSGVYEEKISLKNCFAFGIKRISKLYVLYILMIIAAVPFEILRFGENISGLIGRLICNILLIQSWIPDETFFWSFNWAAWFLSDYFFLVVFFPVLCKILNKISKRGLWILLIYTVQIILAYTFRTTDFSYWFVYIFPIYRMGDFAIGILLGFLYNDYAFRGGISYTVLEIIMAAFCVIIFKIVQNEGVWGEPTIIYIPISSMMIWLFAINKGIISKMFTNKLVIFIGNMSGYGFLLHQMIIRYLDVIFTHIDATLYKGYTLLPIKILLGFMITMFLAMGFQQIGRNINFTRNQSK